MMDDDIKEFWLPIEKCTALMDGVPCGQPVEEDSSHVGLLRVFRCPFGHRSYSTYTGAQESQEIPQDRISFEVVEFRKKRSEETWHLTASCSQWPTEDFISSTSLSPTDMICNECIALR
jgi:hypothetical protein